MRTNPFEGQLERLARTLTEQFGVTVLCQGDNACTDGNRIWLPSLPEPMDGDLEKMVVGYLDHEMGHVAFSDFKVMKEFSEKHPGAEGLLNVVEDALVEQKVMQRWPGVRANLDSMFRQVRGRVMSRLRDASPFRRFCTAVYLKLSHHQDMLGLSKCLAGYEDLLDGYAAVKNSRASAELAERMLERWSRNNPPQKAQQPPPDGASSDSEKEPGDNTDGSGESSQSGDAGHSPDKPHSESDESETAGASDDDSQGDTGDADEPDDADDADGEDGDDTANSDSAQPDGAAPDSEPDQDAEPQAAEAASGDQPANSASGKEEAPTSAETGGASVASGQGGDVAGALIAEVLAEAIAESIAKTDPSTRYRVFTKQDPVSGALAMWMKIKAAAWSPRESRSQSRSRSRSRCTSGSGSGSGPRGWVRSACGGRPTSGLAPGATSASLAISDENATAGFGDAAATDSGGLLALGPRLASGGSDRSRPGMPPHVFSEQVLMSAALAISNENATAGGVRGGDGVEGV